MAGSKLSGRARRIRQEYRALGYHDTAPLAQRWLDKASRLEALSDMTLDLIGSDPKANRKAIVSLQAQAHRLLDRLEADGFRAPQEPPDLARAIAAAQQEEPA